MGHSPVNGRALPIFLLAACAIPTIFGMIRAGEIIITGHWTFDFVADVVDRLPLFLHVVGAVGFLVLGAFQVLPGFRHRHPIWHRRSGPVAIPLGIIGAVSGLWMTLAHGEISGPLLFWGRIGASCVWIGAMALSVGAITHRDFRAHGRWIIRAYALALPAGTLAFILLPMVMILGEDGHDLLFEVVQVLAWPLHLAAAEWIIRRRDAHRGRQAQMLEARRNQVRI